MTKRIAVALLGLTSLSLSAATGLPPLVLPEGVGVNIHFTRGHERDLDLIAAGGFKFIRMDFGWGGTERKKGEYNWADYDELTANLDKRKLRPVFIFDYSNGLYEDTIVSKNPVNGREQRDTASPQKPESVAAFARWAAAAAKHFQGRGVVWEIWNEPNIGFWKPKPDVQQYIALALATCRAVREADPQAVIMGPASSEFPWAFLESLLASGVLEYLDAVSVHPYRNYSRGPETAGEDYLKLRGLIERYAPAGRKNIPIVSGEWGYATHTKGISADTQAAFIARQQLANVWRGVPLSIWYDWKNDGLNPDYNEDNFGTVSNNLAPKLSYIAVQTLTRQLSGFRMARRLDTPAVEDFVLLLVNLAGDQKVAAWTCGKPHEISLDLSLASASDVGIVNGQGQSIATRLQEGKLVLALQPLPQYVTFKKRNRTLSAAAAWSVDGWLPTRVEAGGANKVQIPIQLKNPFDETVQVKLVMESSSGSETKITRVQARQMGLQVFDVALKRRSASSVPLTLKAEFQGFAGSDWSKPCASSEHWDFVVANPLEISLAPVESGLRFQVQNPARVAFDGTALISGARYPVRIKEGVSEFAMIAPASAREASARLLDANGPDATDPIVRGFSPLKLPALKTYLDGDNKVAANADLTEANSPGEQDQPFRRAHRLDYRFEAGWRFARCAPTGNSRIVFEDRPRALGLWVYGDKSGNSLRMRATDAGGQTFQPAGPHLDWTGWRWVEFDLSDLSHAGHWGGANDGVVHGSLRLDTLLLVDGSRNKTGGTIYFAGPVLVY